MRDTVGDAREESLNPATVAFQTGAKIDVYHLHERDDPDHRLACGHGGGDLSVAAPVRVVANGFSLLVRLVRAGPGLTIGM